MGKIQTIADIYTLQARESLLLANDKKRAKKDLYIPYSKKENENTSDNATSHLNSVDWKHNNDLCDTYKYEGSLLNCSGYNLLGVSNLYNSIEQRRNLPFHKYAC